MNWRDITKKDPDSNGSRMWGRLVQATSTARQKVADKYYEVREGGNGTLLYTNTLLTLCSESDDDTPDNTHTQRVLAKYYLEAEGALPPWLPPPPSLATSTTSSSHRPTLSNASSGSGSSMYRAGSKPVSLQDIYDSAGPNQSSPSHSNRVGRNQDLYTNDQSSLARQPLGGDRLRSKLRPTNSRPSPRPGSTGDQESDAPGYSRGSSYSGRTGFGGGDDYDPYSYSQQPGRDPRQGQSSGGLPTRPSGRR